MNLLRLSAGIVLVLAWVGGAPGAQKCNKGSAGQRRVQGKVQAVALTAQGQSATITVRTHHHKKRGAATAAVLHTFTVPQGAVQTVIVAGKGQKQVTAGSLTDIQPGQHVMIVTKKGTPGVALQVSIIIRKRTKKLVQN